MLLSADTQEGYIIREADADVVCSLPGIRHLCRRATEADSADRKDLL